MVTYRAKTGVDVSVLIPDDVADELLAVLNGSPKYENSVVTRKRKIAQKSDQTRDPSVMATAINTTLQTVEDRANCIEPR